MNPPAIAAAHLPRSRLLEAFVELADTLTDDFDVLDYLQALVDWCVELLEVDAASLLLADSHGRLRLIASSDEQSRRLALVQLRDNDGPGLDAYRTGTPVSRSRLADAKKTWPRFAAAATEAGFSAVDALPMKLRRDVIGVLDLFRTTGTALPPESLHAARTLVDIATIGLLQERSVRHNEILAGQLRNALDSRVVVEQAKGIVSVRLGVDQRGAFAALRHYARDHRVKLSDLAWAIIGDPAGRHEIFTEAVNARHRRPGADGAPPPQREASHSSPGERR
ncbi:GAF and ANTAR domain-containing protein [Amycolatopsis mongoliensis]|uniref:GAF and ANTAR domain-containing protein n=1 Tax=Amycolatopsis mongoliensis TaxID=715475 RepID=A0A9Y2NHM0_9PSEU|nr:GAF and ANTAR domain-containing protein [Amycolatopsis sp. 4-36]WIX98334.1 GAF and ANTAR domain-containing protein [Amycolatopsis sp. 4-36]